MVQLAGTTGLPHQIRGRRYHHSKWLLTLAMKCSPPLHLQVARAAVFDADVSQLTGMGFSRKHATEALEECGDDIAMAVEWLFAHCS